MLYLLNLTFYAGDDLPENTDRGVFCLESPKELTEDYIQNAYKEVNDTLNDFLYDEDEGSAQNPYKVSYDNDGSNIDTLCAAVAEHLDVKITRLENNSGQINAITNYFEFEIWQ